MSPQTVDRDVESLQNVIEMIASGRISAEEGRRRFEELWDSAEHDSLVRRVLRELFPSLSKHSST